MADSAKAAWLKRRAERSVLKVSLSRTFRRFEYLCACSSTHSLRRLAIYAVNEAFVVTVCVKEEMFPPDARGLSCSSLSLICGLRSSLWHLFHLPRTNGRPDDVDTNLEKQNRKMDAYHIHHLTVVSGGFSLSTSFRAAHGQLCHTALV